MKATRRDFIRGGVSAFTLTFAAPAYISEIARAQGASRRNLVILYLSGGNDALSTVIPYTDAFYYSRRPTIAVPAGNVLQIGSDPSGKALGLHPRLTGLKQIFDAGDLAVIQRTGYTNSSRSHFLGIDIMQLAPRVTDAAAVAAKYEIPTMQAADCVVCHKTIDPVAGLFQDYNFEGAGLSVLLDILAYNTQYNAFYLNMVANEMFLDTALQKIGRAHV